MTPNATLTAARAAEATLCEQLHRVADELGTIGTNAIETALERIAREAAALKGRVLAARAAVACELALVLESLNSLAADLGADLTPPAALPPPAVQPAPLPAPETAQEQKAPAVAPPATEQPQAQPAPALA